MMTRNKRTFLLSALFFSGLALAQQPAATLPIPRIVSAFPAGAKVGTTVEVTITGTDMEDATGLLFSHPGFRAEPAVESEPKPEPKAKDKTPAKKKGPTPTAVKFKVTVEPDVPPGLYDLRVVSQQGVSNPRFFTVGAFPEVNESEPNNDVPEAQKIAIGTTVNGIIASPTDVDFFQFTANAGQHVLIHCAAGSIESRARPLIELYTHDGRRIAQNRNDRGTDAVIDVAVPIAGTYYVRLCEFAYQFGGPENFYRLTVFAGPWIDAVFPPVVEPGKASPVTLIGRAIPKDAVRQVITAPTKAGELTGRLKFDPTMGLQDGFEFRLPGSPVGVPIFLAREPVVLESDQPNDTPETAQRLNVPCELCGRIDVKNDRDWFRFSAKKGELLIIDLAAQRLGSNIDAFLTILDATSKREIVGENQLDDDLDSLHPIGFFSRNADPPTYRFFPPADGDYLVRVASRDANVSFGPRAIYRLRIAPPRPDFRVVVMPRSRELPSAITCRPGTDTAVEVYVHRIDGFAGPVTVIANNLPVGVTAIPAQVGSNQKWGTLVLKTKPGVRQLAGFVGFIPRTRNVTTDFTGKIDCTAMAEIDGAKVSRPARPATITWGINQGGNNPTATRLDQTLPIAIRGNYAVPEYSLAAQLDKATTKGKDGKDIPIKPPFAIKPGEKIAVPISVAYTGKDRPPIALSVEPTHSDNQRSPLAGNNANVTGTIAKDKSETNLTFELRPNATPGQYRLVVRGDMTANVNKTTEKKTAINIGLSAFAPIDIRVIPTSLAKLIANSPTVKVGGTAELIVKVERQFDFAGEFVVVVTLPEGKGLTAAKAVIPAGKDEVKIPIAASKEAKPGQVPNVLITAIAKYEGAINVSHDVKVNLNVTK